MSLVRSDHLGTYTQGSALVGEEWVTDTPSHILSIRSS